MSPSPGDFGVVRTDGRIAAAIRWATQSEWNHAVIYLGDGLIIEANPSGVAVARLDEYAPEQILWSTLDIADDVREQLCVEARKLEGVPYNFVDIAALLLSALGVVVLPVFDRLNRPDRLICSQLVVVVYAAAGIELFPGKANCRVTPGDLADLILHRPVPENR